MSSEDDAAAAHLRKIALPTLIGQEIGQKVFGKPYVVHPWIAYVEQRIVEAIRNKSTETYLAINAPPQTGKSTIVGMLLPFWLTGMFPDDNVIYVSYSDDFSLAKGKDVRNLHRVYGRELFGTAIDTDFDSAGEWRIAGHRGGMLSVGIGGQVTGKPADTMIIDDLLKDPQEARSKATKLAHVEAWDGTMSTRIQGGGSVILIATRWAEDDLTGTLKDRCATPGYDGPKWEFLEFPAFAEAPEEYEPEDGVTWHDVLGRTEGEVLDCRFSRLEGRPPEDFFTLKKKGMDATIWSATYQQHPSIRAGGLFPREDWLYENPETFPLMEELIRVWDLAATEDGGDYTVGTKMGRGSDGRYYVLDVKRFRKGPGDVQDAIERQAPIDGYGCKIRIEEEKGGSGKTNTEFFRRLLPMYNVAGCKAEGDKVSRLGPASMCQNNRLIVLPIDNAVSWSVKEFVDECSKLMPDGRGPRHDDQLDTMGYCMIDLVGRLGVGVYIPGLDAPTIDEGGEIEFSPSDAYIGAERFLTKTPVIVGGHDIFG